MVDCANTQKEEYQQKSSRGASLLVPGFKRDNRELKIWANEPSKESLGLACIFYPLNAGCDKMYTD